MPANHRQTTAPAWIILVNLTLAAGMLGGCASRVVEVTEPLAERPREPAGRVEPAVRAENLEEPGPRTWAHADGQRNAGGDEDPGARYADARAIRTADGRPAPHGRDPATGRAIGAPQARPDHEVRQRPATPPVLAASASPRRPQGAAFSVIVGKGETLHSLARRLNVSVDELKRANGLTSDQIRVGQKLVVPG